MTTAAAIDSESLGPSVDIEVTATSTDGSTNSQVFTVTINDVDEFDVTAVVDSNGAAGGHGCRERGQW